MLVVCALALPVLAFAQKFGTVDTNTVFQLMPETKKAQETLEAAQKKYETELKSLNAEFEKKYSELQNISQDTPDAIKQRRIQEVQDLQQKVEQFQQTASSDIQRQSQQLMAPISQKLTETIQAVGKAGNYTFVFEQATCIYKGADVVDLTPQVKAKLGLK